MIKYVIQEDADAIWIQWGKLSSQHIGVSEEINLIGLQMIVDRNKKGRVCGIEIIKEKIDAQR